MLYYAIFIPKGEKPFPKKIIYTPALSKYAENWGNKGDSGLIAVSDELKTKIGATWLRIFTSENKGYAYIDEYTPELSIAVLPKYRGNGVGTVLLKEQLKIAKKYYPKVSLSVSADNPAKNLYLKFGFKTVNDINNTLTMINIF